MAMTWEGCIRLLKSPCNSKKRRMRPKRAPPPPISQQYLLPTVTHCVCLCSRRGDTIRLY